MYADVSNVARDISSIIPHAVRVQASFSLRQDALGWRLSKTTPETLQENVVVKQYAYANNEILAGDDSVLDRSETDNDLELKRGRGQGIAQNGQGPRLCGDVAGQPKPTYYTEGIAR